MPAKNIRKAKKKNSVGFEGIRCVKIVTLAKLL